MGFLGTKSVNKLSKSKKSKSKNNNSTNNNFTNNNYSNNISNNNPTNSNSNLNSSNSNPTVFAENFVAEFSKAMNNYLSNPYFYNPIWQNEILKDINMHPTFFDRDKVEKLIENPRANEQALRQLAQYLENYIMQFKRLVYYLANILTFDNYLEPTNADEEDMKTPAFKKSYKKVLNWLDRFDVKKEFPSVMKAVIAEDAKFYYLRESDFGYTLQEMPSDYCKINSKNDLGYQYAFNLTYFQRAGVNLEDYAPEFKEYYIEFLENKNDQNRYFYWHDLDPNKAVCFKFDENHAGLTPPLLSLFIDSIEIATYKNLLKTKTKLETWKLLINKIPRHKDNKSANVKDDFAMQAATAGMFNNIIKSVVPEGVVPIATPFEETKAIDFDKAESKSDIVGTANQNFWDTSGAPLVLFGGQKFNASTLKANVQTDYYFVHHMYKQFEIFVNNQLKLNSGRFRFKIHFEGSIFDIKDRTDAALKAAQYGAPKSWLACAMGKTPNEMVNLINFENSLAFMDNMKPLISSHVQSGDLGRTKKDVNDMTDKGIEQIDNNDNQNR